MTRIGVFGLVTVVVCCVMGALPVKDPQFNPNEGELVQKCQSDKLTVYKVVVHTFWTRDRFPKHYPDWRPTAQWSKVVGYSHNQSVVLFRLGSLASRGLKKFAESGQSDEIESQRQNGILDQFYASPISTGAGRAEAQFFVDGNFSHVSLISRIIPSPDWFIGIDSFDLCIDGNWIDTITIEADPIDAGTDNGFTFTAPNWPTEPQGIVHKMTSRYPSHPAGSFFYPSKKRLPPIATFQFIKLREYEISDVFHHSEDEQQYDVLQLEQYPKNSLSVINNNDIADQIEQERLEELVTRIPVGSSSTNSIISKGDKNAIINSIVASYQGKGIEKDIHHMKKFKRKFRKYSRKVRLPKDCKVGEWSEWGPCSKTCGIGEMKRTRKVMKQAKRGGKMCEPLLETKWCGSARSCTKEYFNW